MEQHHEPEVQGLPRSLVSSLCGIASLLLLTGLVCALAAAWEQLDTWLKVLLLLTLPITLAVLHVCRARRQQGVTVFSAAFAAMIAANALLVPLGIFLSLYLSPYFGAVALILYALAHIWYGAYYHSAMVISAACALAFAGALSLPLYCGLGALVSSVILVGQGLLCLGVAYSLHKKRAARLAQLRIAQRKQELSRRDNATES